MQNSHVSDPSTELHEENFFLQPRSYVLLRYQNMSLECVSLSLSISLWSCPVKNLSECVSWMYSTRFWIQIWELPRCLLVYNVWLSSNVHLFFECSVVRRIWFQWTAQLTVFLMLSSSKGQTVTRLVHLSFFFYLEFGWATLWSKKWLYDHNLSHLGVNPATPESLHVCSSVHVAIGLNNLLSQKQLCIKFPCEG